MTRQTRGWNVLPPGTPARTMVVLGSGGHTAEMMRVLRVMPLDRFDPLLFVVASSDSTSEVQLRNCPVLQPIFAATDSSPPLFLRIPRSREVKQSYLSSVFTTLRSLVVSTKLIFRHRPHLLLCNGPGTCLPLMVSAFVAKVLGWCDTHITFVESFCRVQTLSLCGHLVLPICDRFVVLWPQLQKKYPSTLYLGGFV